MEARLLTAGKEALCPLFPDDATDLPLSFLFDAGTLLQLRLSPYTPRKAFRGVLGPRPWPILFIMSMQLAMPLLFLSTRLLNLLEVGRPSLFNKYGHFVVVDSHQNSFLEFD